MSITVLDNHRSTNGQNLARNEINKRCWQNCMHTDDRTKHEYKFCSFTVLVTQNTPINDTLLNQNTNFVKSTIRTCLESSHVLTILQSLYNYLLQPVVTIRIECLWKQYRDSEQTETKIWRFPRNIPMHPQHNL